MPEYIVSFSGPGGPLKIRSDGEKNLLELLRENGAAVHAPCGGNGKCGRCLVTVTGDCRDMSGNIRRLEGESVPACRFRPAGDISAESAARREIVAADAADIAPGGRGLGLAVDIGTTTLAAYIYDLSTGRCLASGGEMNAQRAYGGDVISRIQHASRPGGLEELRRAVCRQTEALARRLGGGTEGISRVSIAGNTVMEHIFAGLSPESIGRAPFAPESLFGFEAPASDYLEGFAPDCRAYLCPAVAGYVGGDITAGLAAAGAFQSARPVLFIDVGTNGELCVGGREGFLCAAAAAGPAFEGAEMECGAPAGDGSIDKVRADMSFSVIGGGAPRSICGSGLIDASAALLARGTLDESGRLSGGRWDFGNGVYISQRDIRRFQLAKAALRAGIDTLLSQAGVKSADIGETLIAGGFGAYMDIKSAGAVGLLPPALCAGARHVGNSAGRGAALALTPSGREQVEKAAALCGYLELSASGAFNKRYVEAMAFGEEEDEEDD